MPFAVYLLANKHQTVYYIGVTNNLERRLAEHYRKACQNDKKSFTGRYQCYYCIAYESQPDAATAIARETEVKGWSRKKKLAWAQQLNPGLNPLNEEILGKGWEEAFKI